MRRPLLSVCAVCIACTPAAQAPPPPAPTPALAPLPVAPPAAERASPELPEATTEPPAPPPAPPPPPPPPSAADARSCAARGGKLQPVCMGGIIECVVRYRDAGKRCTDKKDCTGDCLFFEDDPARKPGGPTTGKCQATSDSCGCAARIVGGVVQATMCLD